LIKTDSERTKLWEKLHDITGLKLVVAFWKDTFENNTMLCLIKTNAKGELVDK